MTTLKTTARKRIITGITAVLGMALMAFEAMPAQAAPPPHAPAWGYRRKQQTANYNRTHRRHTPTYYDIDGDGIRNNRDRDVDGDGILNGRDRDIDGDGILNGRDGADYVSARWRRNSQGRWTRVNPVQRTFNGVMNGTPAGYYRDRSGRLIRRPAPVKRSVFTRRATTTRRVRDKDQDGIRNSRDRDIDGDGVRNSRDRDKDGDRIRNRNDRFDKNPRRR
jgi:hypothetical protein